METVKPSESILLRQVARGLPDRRCDLDSEIIRPVLIQIGFGQSVLLGREPTFTTDARESAPCFGIGDYRSADERCRGDKSLDVSGAAFFDIELDEAAGVEVEDQRRSSRTMSDALLPRFRGRWRDPEGLPPLQLATPLSTSFQARRAVSFSSIELSRAMECPCSVMTIRSPSWTRFR